MNTMPHERVLPPVASKREHPQIWHGATVTDDYFWLREKSDPEVIRHLEAENAYTAEATKDLQPFVEQLYREMLGRIKQTDLSVPVQRGGYFYYSRTEEGKQYSIQCRRKNVPEALEEVLLDANELAKEHKFVGLDAFEVSDDGNLLAYTIDYTGFRQFSLQVKDLRTGQLLPDTTGRVTSVNWAADNQTLFLTTEDATTKRSNQLLRHVLGEKAFEAVYEEEDELYDIALRKTRDKKFLLLEITSKDTTEVRFLPSDQREENWKAFWPREKKHRYYLDHRAELFYVRSNRNAKDFQVLTVSQSERQTDEQKVFVPHQEGILIENIDLFRDFAVVLEKSEALNRMRFYDFKTNEWSAIEFPEPVFSVFPGGTPDFESKTYRYTYQSFITPPSVFDYDLRSGKSQLLKQQEVLGGYHPGQYVSERLWITAHDGTRIPVSIVYKKGLKRDGQSPLLLYGYGSYGIGMSAAFSSSRLSLLDRGVAYAIAHIRGGDEMGEQWRENGMLMKKKNTFQDFIDCAEWLIQEKWTSPDKLMIEGRSAGGLLMGAVVNMRPDLFRAVHAAVPFLDVINTMMDASLPLTVGEYLEWGNPNEKDAYEYMKSYSPYDNLEKRAYPAMLVTTSFNDSQVMYWEPAKYVARLRTLRTDDRPLLLKTKMEPAGHGGASGRYDRIKDTAFEYAWMLSQLGVTNGQS